VNDTNIFDFEYPIFDEAYRPILEKKIINYYYMHEIGYETEELFIHFLKNRMQLTMPNFNKMYLANELDLKPIMAYVEEREGYRENTGESESEASGTGHNVFEDTPDGKFQIQEGYATNINDSNTNSANENTIHNVEEYYNKLTHNNPTLNDAEQVKKFMQNLVNVDMLVIDELRTLFMGVM